MDLKDEKKVIFTAQSCKNFHQRMLICRYVFDQGAVPVNPFNLFGYFLYELVDRDLVRNGNNALLRRCDELWVFGEVSDGVLAEIKIFKELNRPIRFFDISGLPQTIKEISKEEVAFEDEVREFKGEIFT
jgi:hypothetical protein